MEPISDFFRNVNSWLNSLTAEDLEPYRMPAAIAFLVVVAIVAIALRIWEKRRREALGRKAKKLGLRFNPDPDYDLAARLEFLNRLGEGVNRYAFNIMQGVYREHPVRYFDYHYAIESTDGKGRTRRTSYYLSVYVLHHPTNFPEVEIYPQKFYHRIGQALGMESINFESVAFNKAFVVRSANRRFAYDLCHPRMLALLLKHKDINLELEGHCIACCYRHRHKPGKIRPHFDLLVDIRELIPEYLYAE